MWNTGIGTLKNESQFNFLWIDLETVGNFPRMGRIGANESMNMAGLILPWAINVQEMGSKSIAFYDDQWLGQEIPSWGPDQMKWFYDRTLTRLPNGSYEWSVFPVFYLFQNYDNDQAYYCVRSDSTEWSDIRWCGAGPSSYVAVTVQSGQPISVAAQ